MIEDLASGIVGGVTGMFLLWLILVASGRSTTRLRVFLVVGVVMGAIGPTAFHAAAW